MLVNGNGGMILVTGGLGFLGLHTTRALLDLGESCVLVQRREPNLPGELADEAGTRVFTEQADIAKPNALLKNGTRYKITGIIHLAGSVPWSPSAAEPVDGTRSALGSLLNVVQAAQELQTSRIAIASTIGVYGGVQPEGPMREDMPLPAAPLPISRRCARLPTPMTASTCATSRTEPAPSHYCNSRLT